MKLASILAVTGMKAQNVALNVGNICCIHKIQGIFI